MISKAEILLGIFGVDVVTVSPENGDGEQHAETLREHDGVSFGGEQSQVVLETLQKVRTPGGCSRHPGLTFLVVRRVMVEMLPRN